MPWNHRWRYLRRRWAWRYPSARIQDYLDVCAQDTSGEKSDFLRDLLRPSHEFLVEHAQSVAILAMMSTGLA
jgi:hypothetical protein